MWNLGLPVKRLLKWRMIRRVITTKKPTSTPPHYITRKRWDHQYNAYVVKTDPIVANTKGDLRSKETATGFAKETTYEHRHLFQPDKAFIVIFHEQVEAMQKFLKEILHLQLKRALHHLECVMMHSYFIETR